MLFLPASLVSSIFGMGFFSTSQGIDGQATLLISKNWWLYVAISVPLTVACLGFMGGCNLLARARRARPADLETVGWSELKEE